MCEKKVSDWIKKTIPDVYPIRFDYLDFSITREGRERHMPDFLIFSKKPLKPLCLIEVKGTQSIDREEIDFWWINTKYSRGKGSEWYNLDYVKHKNYIIVSKELEIPTYLMILEGESESMLYWARIDNIEPISKGVYMGIQREKTSRNFILLTKGGEGLKNETTKLMSSTMRA